MVSVELDFYNFRMFCLILKVFAYKMRSLGILYKFLGKADDLGLSLK